MRSSGLNVSFSENYIVSPSHEGLQMDIPLRAVLAMADGKRLKRFDFDAARQAFRGTSLNEDLLRGRKKHAGKSPAADTAGAAFSSAG